VQYQWNFGLNFFKSRLGSLQQIEDEDTLLSFWARVARSFSGCDLTFEKDKLVAVSGIVKVILDKLPPTTQYLAGFWSTNLEFQLLWRNVSGGTRLKPRPTQYRAPSWSWASIDEAVYFDANSSSRLISTVQNFSVELLGLDPTGQVKSGFIDLKGDHFLLLMGSMVISSRIQNPTTPNTSSKSTRNLPQRTHIRFTLIPRFNFQLTEYISCQFRSTNILGLEGSCYYSQQAKEGASLNELVFCI
jgi:hypothetical protein